MSVQVQSKPFMYCRSHKPHGTGGFRTNRILVSDALTQLRTLPSSGVDCVITSPPYFLLRNYGHDDQIGLESNIDEWVGHLVNVMDEIARVLKPSGGVWLNLGDSYSRGPRYGALAKSLLLGPERVVLALADRGWVVRNKVVWSKPNPMPASVADRLTCSWEPIYFLVRSRDYHFDLDRIREPHTSLKPPSAGGRMKYGGRKPTWAGPLAGSNDGLVHARAEGRPGHPLGKNPGDVWSLSTAGFRGAHFAVYPEQLVEQPLLASCPERVCNSCGRPWSRQLRRDRLGELRQECTCVADWHPGLVLDPFMGSGTTAVVAERNERRWLGIELNPAYAELASERIATARAPTSTAAKSSSKPTKGERHEREHQSTQQLRSREGLPGHPT